MKKLDKSEIEDEYIAIALDRTSVGQNRPKISLILGDQIKTRCDISGNTNSVEGYNSKNTYVAYNKRLSLSESYKIFLVTSTPTRESVSFGASEGLLIGKSFTDITWAVVAGGILAVLSAFVCLCYVRHRNNKRKDDVHGTISSISLNVSKKEKIEPVSAGKNPDFTYDDVVSVYIDQGRHSLNFVKSRVYDLVTVSLRIVIAKSR
uniref:uncharacterized protein LOC120342431 n=1 Tax=Styela clava TaxID=7725 RepID=UPI00193A16FB|nr:uncharacterized protein LOC120342431 [Styela clava]